VKIEVDGTVRDSSRADGSFSVAGLTKGKSYRFRLLGRGDTLLDSTITIQSLDASLPNDKQTAKALSLKVRLTGKELDARFFRFPLAVGNQWNYEVSQRLTQNGGGTSLGSWTASMSITKVEVDGKDTLWHFFTSDFDGERKVVCRQTDSVLHLWNTPPRLPDYSPTLFFYSYRPDIPMNLDIRTLVADTTISNLGGSNGNSTIKTVHKVGIVNIYNTLAYRNNSGLYYSSIIEYKLTSYTLK
jgi:hypothetical protein